MVFYVFVEIIKKKSKHFESQMIPKTPFIWNNDENAAGETAKGVNIPVPQVIFATITNKCCLVQK